MCLGSASGTGPHCPYGTDTCKMTSSVLVAEHVSRGVPGGWGRGAGAGGNTTRALGMELSLAGEGQGQGGCCVRAFALRAGVSMPGGPRYGCCMLLQGRDGNWPEGQCKPH